MGLKLFHKIKKENFRVFTVINGVFEMDFLKFCSLQFRCSKWQ